MGEALVPHAQRLRIGRSNFCLLSDIKSKESTLQLIYDVLRICLFFKAFLVTADLKTILSSDLVGVIPQEECPRLTTSAKGKQAAKSTKAKSLSALSEMKEPVLYQGFPMHPLMSLRKNSPRILLMMKVLMMKERTEVGRDDDKDDDEEGGDKDQEYDEEEYAKETRDEESFDPIPQTPEGSKDEGDGEEDLCLNVGKEERHVEKEEEDELYRDQQSSSVSSQFVTSMLNQTLDVGMELIFETTSQMDVQPPTSVAPLPITAPTMTSSTIATTTTISQVPILPTTAPSTIIQNLLDFSTLFGFDNRLRTLEANFYEFTQRNQFAGAVSAILEIVQQYMDQRMNEAVKVTVNEQLEAKVLTRSSHLSNTSYAVAADLSEMELKKILIEKMEGNKFIQRSDEQKNLYKALDEKPSAGPDRGSKRCREGKEPESASAPSETATRSAGRSTKGSRSRQASASESSLAEEPVQTTFQMDEPLHPEFNTCVDDQPII
uniref:Uncharacterized protein n=1 Tax=Tanacetum cinerariifolium TaxID=118510 RepID=A0A6L2MR26_TANCI|nr:hypothetical protein [Tanacetum cinerariifolium]